MAFNLADIATERQTELEDAVSQAKKARNDLEARELLLKAIDRVRESLSSIVVARVSEGEVSVNNFDEVKAALRNELNRISLPIINAIRNLRIPASSQDAAVRSIERRNDVAMDLDFDIQIIKRPKQSMVVENISDIPLPTDLSINNLDEIEKYFKSLERAFKDIKVDVPELTLPEQAVNVEPPDLSPLLKALDPLKFLSDRAKKPLSVRLSDGQQFVKAMKTVMENQNKQMQAFSQGLNESSARKAMKAALKASVGGVVAGTGSLELTDATSAVQITATSTPCNYVDISTNAGLANIGTSTAVATSGGEIGVTIYPGNLPYRVMTDNLNKVYAAGATNSRLSWTYYA